MGWLRLRGARIPGQRVRLPETYSRWPGIVPTPALAVGARVRLAGCADGAKRLLLAILRMQVRRSQSVALAAFSSATVAQQPDSLRRDADILCQDRLRRWSSRVS